MRSSVVAVTGLVAALYAPTLGAQNQRLQGLTSFSVTVLPFGTVVPASVSPATLQATMELELRRSGITVVRNDTARTYVGDIEIRLGVLSLATDSRPASAFVYSLATRVRRWVRTPAPDSTWFSPVAWETGVYGYAPNTTDLQQSATSTVAEAATLLANAILAAKKKP